MRGLAGLAELWLVGMVIGVAVILGGIIAGAIIASRLFRNRPMTASLLGALGGCVLASGAVGFVLVVLLDRGVSDPGAEFVYRVLLEIAYGAIPSILVGLIVGANASRRRRASLSPAEREREVLQAAPRRRLARRVAAVLLLLAVLAGKLEARRRTAERLWDARDRTLNEERMSLERHESLLWGLERRRGDMELAKKEMASDPLASLDFDETHARLAAFDSEYMRAETPAKIAALNKERTGLIVHSIRAWRAEGRDVEAAEGWLARDPLASIDLDETMARLVALERPSLEAGGEWLRTREWRWYLNNLLTTKRLPQ